MAEKAGYNQGKTYDETLYEGNLEDYAYISLDNKAQVTGRVTAPGGGGLSGVSVRAKGKDHQNNDGRKRKLYAETARRAVYDPVPQGRVRAKGRARPRSMRRPR